MERAKEASKQAKLVVTGANKSLASHSLAPTAGAIDVNLAHHGKLSATVLRKLLDGVVVPRLLLAKLQVGMHRPWSVTQDQMDSVSGISSPLQIHLAPACAQSPNHFQQLLCHPKAQTCDSHTAPPSTTCMANAGTEMTRWYVCPQLQAAEPATGGSSCQSNYHMSNLVAGEAKDDKPVVLVPIIKLSKLLPDPVHSLTPLGGGHLPGMHRRVSLCSS